MKKMRKKAGLVVCGAVLSFALPLFGLTVLQLNLEQLTVLSEKVFVGRCLSVKERRDKEGRPVQYVTFEVEEMLKGDGLKKITFKQIGYASHQSGDRTVQGLFREMPTYRVGEEAIVFLSEVGSLGLTAPVGLHQGKFVVQESPAGGKMVVNGAGNRGLFLGWKKSSKFKTLRLTTGEKDLLSDPEGELPFETFTSLVKKLATP